MAARALWKAVLRVGDESVPVKLYSAIEDQAIHFRLLHRADHAPVRQAMVNPATEAVVEPDDIRRAWITPGREVLVLDDDELAALEPAPSREIRVRQALPPAAIDHRWYLRPYLLGPDTGGDAALAALRDALAASEREGLATWVMRGREYVGVLRLFGAQPALVTLRYADQVVDLGTLAVPAGAEPAARELAMANRLLEMLAGPFDPGEWHDTYRARVRELLERKAAGASVAAPPPPPRRAPADLAAALEASLERVARHG